MRHHSHLTLEEREDIMVLRRQGRSVAEIAAAIGRDKSTVSRELSRNMCGKGSPCEFYRASTAQRRYEQRRQACRRPAILDDSTLLDLVAELFLGEQWSPEQIEGRLALERGRSPVSDTTIYRGVRDGRFDGFLPGQRKASRKLRHRGKRRRAPGTERRGKIRISHGIDERPAGAEGREEVGHWEADTVAGKAGGACLVTNVDRASRYLVGGKAQRRASGPVNEAMAASLSGRPLLSVTADRGSEFAAHADVTAELGVEFYFALPHHPWQRGTNENTNGLLREYFPKGKPIEASEEEVQAVYDKLNRRPRKCLGYRTPYEVFHSTSLQLV